MKVPKKEAVKIPEKNAQLSDNLGRAVKGKENESSQTQLSRDFGLIL